MPRVYPLRHYKVSKIFANDNTLAGSCSDRVQKNRLPLKRKRRNR